MAWETEKSIAPALTYQLAKVRRRSFGLARSIPARSHAWIRSRRTFRHGRNSAAPSPVA